MKKLAVLIVLIQFSVVVQAQTRQKTDTLKMVSWLKADKDSVKVFYGLPAHKILALTVDEAKKFIKVNDITVSNYFSAKLEAQIYLKEENIKKDSIELIKIYDRIEKKLGMRKSNGNSP